MTTFLVTGVGGFIGSNLAEELLARNNTVVGLDDFSTGRREHLQSFRDHDRFTLHEGDVRNKTTVTDVVAGIDHVLHHAAVTSVPESIENPTRTTETNCTGTTNVLVAARDAAVDTVVVASSSAVYGSSKELQSAR